MSQKSTTVLILLTAMNLRLAVTAITPLFAAIQAGLHVTAAVTALLVTIPLLCFAGGALLAPLLHWRFGVTSLLLCANGSLVVANLWRPTSPTSLLLSTVLIGLAIAVLNVVVPIMITQVSHSAASTTRLTSYYSVTMNVMAALGTALAIPLANWLGWAMVLRLFALPAVLAFLVASRVRFPRATQTPSTTVGHTHLMTLFFHDQAARTLTLFMGCQSLIFYSLIAWLPAILHALGASENEAGLLLSLFQFVGIPAALLLNVVTHHRALLLGLAGGYLLGLGLLVWSGLGWWLGSLLLGFTCSLIFSLALTFIGTSSPDVAQVANRSALAQSLGYLFAAIGPVLLGTLHDTLGDWRPIIGGLAALMMVTIYLGLRVVAQRAH